MRVYTPPPPTAVAVALGTVVLAVVVAVVAVRSSGAPAIGDRPAAPGDFDVARAARTVGEIARAPHPLGSPEQDRVRRALVGRLEALGLEVEVQQDTVVERFPSYVLAARVQNIVARRSGSDPEDREALLLAAHYDTRPTTPGAGDDSSGIAVILETLRALDEGDPIDRDIVVLLSDGEELGLLGARAFVERHRWAESIGLVMNFEARGNRGAAIMFETGRGNRGLVDAFARVAPFPTANSLTFDVYQRMPNDTDFTVFKEAGWTGYNFAFIEGYPAYHTGLDRAQDLSVDSLAQEGANALALVRHFGSAELEVGSDGAVYFNPFGRAFVHYPRARAAIGVFVAGCLVVAIAFLGRRRGWLSAGALLHGLIFWALVVVGAPIGGTAAWLFFRQLAPALERGPHGFHYASIPALVALLLIVASVASFLAARQLGPRNLVQLGFAIAVGWTALAILSLVDLTGASYLLLWPLLALLVGLLVALGVEREDPSSPRVALALGVAALPAVLLFAPVVHLMTHALTLQLAIVALLVAALGGSVLLPQLSIVGRSWGLAWVFGLAVLGIGGLAWIGLTSEFSTAAPRTNNLLYVGAADGGEARWWSFDSEADDWTAEFVDPGLGRMVMPRLLPLSPGAHGLFGAAPAFDAPAPATELLRDDREGGGRQIEVQIRSQRGASNLHFLAEAAVPISRLEIDGQAVEIDADGLPELRLVYFGAPAAGVKIALDLPGRWPVEALVGDQTYGLEPLGVAARPEGLIPSSSWWTDSVFLYTDTLF